MSRDWKSGAGRRLFDGATLECCSDPKNKTSCQDLGESKTNPNYLNNPGTRVTQYQVGMDGIAVIIAQKASSGQPSKAYECIFNHLNGGLTLAQLRWMFTQHSDDDLEANGIASLDKVVNRGGVSFIQNSNQKRWKHLHSSCADIPINLYGPGSDSGTYSFFGEIVFNGENFSEATRAMDNLHYPGEPLYKGTEDDHELLEWVLHDEGGISYVGYSHSETLGIQAVPVSPEKAIGGNVNLLTTNAEKEVIKTFQVPSLAAIGNGAYSVLTRPLYMNYRHEFLDNTQNLLRYTLTLDGQKFVGTAGYVSLTPAEIKDMQLRMESMINFHNEVKKFTGQLTVYWGQVAGHAANSIYTENGGYNTSWNTNFETADMTQYPSNEPIDSYTRKEVRLVLRNQANAYDFMQYQIQCLAGYYWDKSANVCTACPAATYKPSPDIPDASAQYGTKGDSAITRSKDNDCKQTFDGYIAPNPGTSVPDACPKGKIMNPNRIQCDSCLAGTFASKEASTSCTDCSPGTFSPNDGADICQPCPLGTYGVNGKSKQCTSCPIAMMITKQMGSKTGPEQDCICPAGYAYSFIENTCKQCVSEGIRCVAGTTESKPLEYAIVYNISDPELNRFDYPEQLPVIDEKYYAPADDVLSIYDCRDKAYCPQGAPGLCPHGRHNIACGECLPGYRPVATGDQAGECEKCPDGAEYIAIPFSLLMVFFITFLHQLFVTRITKGGDAAFLYRFHVGSIFVVMLQMILAVSRLPLNWGALVDSVYGVFGSLLNALSIINIAQILPVGYFDINCGGGNFDPVGAMVWKALIVPWALLTSALSHLFLIKFNPLGLMGPKDKTYHLDINVLKSTLGMVVYLLFCTISIMLVEPLQCLGNPNGQRTVNAYPSIVCWDSDKEGRHVPMLIIGILGFLFIPAVFVVVAVHAVIDYTTQVKSKDRMKFIRKTTFLFLRFQPGRYWFVLVFLGRNTVLAIAPLLSNDVSVQVMFTMTVLLGYLILQIRIFPWRESWLNYLDAGLVCGIITLLVAGCLYTSLPITNPGCAVFGLIIIAAIITATFWLGIFGSLSPKNASLQKLSLNMFDTITGNNDRKKERFMTTTDVMVVYPQQLSYQAFFLQAILTKNGITVKLNTPGGTGSATGSGITSSNAVTESNLHFLAYRARKLVILVPGPKDIITWLSNFDTLGSIMLASYFSIDTCVIQCSNFNQDICLSNYSLQTISRHVPAVDKAYLSSFRVDIDGNTPSVLAKLLGMNKLEVLDVANNEKHNSKSVMCENILKIPLDILYSWDAAAVVCAETALMDLFCSRWGLISPSRPFNLQKTMLKPTASGLAACKVADGSTSSKDMKTNYARKRGITVVGTDVHTQFAKANSQNGASILQIVRKVSQISESLSGTLRKDSGLNTSESIDIALLADFSHPDMCSLAHLIQDLSNQSPLWKVQIMDEPILRAHSSFGGIGGGSTSLFTKSVVENYRYVAVILTRSFVQNHPILLRALAELQETVNAIPDKSTTTSNTDKETNVSTEANANITANRVSCPKTEIIGIMVDDFDYDNALTDMAVSLAQYSFPAASRSVPVSGEPRALQDGTLTEILGKLVFESNMTLQEAQGLEIIEQMDKFRWESLSTRDTLSVEKIINRLDRFSLSVLGSNKGSRRNSGSNRGLLNTVATRLKDYETKPTPLDLSL